jgi:ectoine hydroxylase-related dioxygenase (phytanoyl-CoA dioxygenase family)
MKILNTIRQLFSSTNKSMPNKYAEIRNDSFFLDPKHQLHYQRYGWVKIENVVEQSEIDSFLDTFKKIEKMEGFELNENLLNSGRLFNPDIRKNTQSVINLNAKTILPRMFDMTKTDTHTGGAYQVKPPHKNSDLLIHQDSTVIDEETDYCLFVWVPFCDVTEENGIISFVNGSHLWGNTQRSLGVPWQFKKNIDVLYRHTTPVAVKKGDVLVFDPACIHASSPNLSKEIRHAITITVLRKNYQLVYYFRNPELDDSLIEKYYVTEDFYYDYDFISKPDETKWRKEIVPYKNFDLSSKQLLSSTDKCNRLKLFYGRSEA